MNSLLSKTNKSQTPSESVKSFKSNTLMSPRKDLTSEKSAYIELKKQDDLLSQSALERKNDLFNSMSPTGQK